METGKGLFTLEIDSTAKNHLKHAAKWARFLAIVGFGFLVCLVILCIIVTIETNERKARYGYDGWSDGDMIGSIIASLVFLILYFFPCLFILKFANKMKAAIDTDNVDLLNDSFKNLKVTFRYVGVVTIIFLVLFILGMLSSL